MPKQDIFLKITIFLLIGQSCDGQLSLFLSLHPFSQFSLTYGRTSVSGFAGKKLALQILFGRNRRKIPLTSRAVYILWQWLGVTVTYSWLRVRSRAPRYDWDLLRFVGSSKDGGCLDRSVLGSSVLPGHRGFCFIILLCALGSRGLLDPGRDSRLHPNISRRSTWGFDVRRYTSDVSGGS